MIPDAVNKSLWNAAYNGNEKLVQGFLEAGANPDVTCNGRSAFDVAIYDRPNRNIAKLLVQHGAHVPQFPIEINLQTIQAMDEEIAMIILLGDSKSPIYTGIENYQGNPLGIKEDLHTIVLDRIATKLCFDRVNDKELFEWYKLIFPKKLYEEAKELVCELQLEDAKSDLNIIEVPDIYV
jgi:ankyrin repeat protein